MIVFKRLLLVSRHSSMYISAALAGLMLLCWLLGEQFNSAFEYDPSAIKSGQWWRIYTGNFVHFTLWHTVMNCTGLVVLGAWLWPPKHTGRFVVALIVLPICVGVGMWLLDESIHSYRGFSGVFWGLLLMAFLAQFFEDRWLYGGAILLTLGKITYEQTPWFDELYLTEQIGAAVGTEAHLYGVLGTMVLVAIFWVCDTRGKSPRPTPTQH